MTAVVGALHSDHVNYLIFRYLQEAGHESAALAFGADWHRPPEYHDPETLPFARVVRRHELISVIQDGLLHDELLARVKKNERRFLWTSVNARDGVQRTDGAVVLENGSATGGGGGGGGAAAGPSRPTSSSAKRKGRPPPPPQPMRAPDEFPTPAPKRQRRSEGSEGVHLNGDRERDRDGMMDVDAASVSAEADEDADTASPEPEVIEIPERYDSMDVAVQTEVKTGPKTSTMYWKIDKPGATVFHSMWNPNAEAESSARALLAVGEGLCRFYTVPEDAEDAKEVLSADPLSLPPNSVITASTWHPRGHIATCAVDSIRSGTDSHHESQQTILDINFDPNGIRSADYSVTPHFAAGGMVLALRYSPSGKHLLVARTNLIRGLVSIYDVSTPGATTHTPVAWRLFEQPVLDAAWHGPGEFVVCGDRGLVKAYRVDPSALKEDGMLTEENFSTQGLHGIDIEMYDFDDEGTMRWDKVRCEEQSGTIALASSEGRRLMLETQHPHPLSAGSEIRFPRQIALPGQLTALAFQPRTQCTVDGHDTSVLLAAAFVDGTCLVYRCTKADEVKGYVSLHLADGPALALSWSPTGAYLALGGIDLVQIWETRRFLGLEGESNGALSLHDEPLVSWRPDSNAVGQRPRNGEHEEGLTEEEEQLRPFSEPSLSWSAEGESLAFAVDKQIAVIRFRPPLLGERQGVEVNGYVSP